MGFYPPPVHLFFKTEVENLMHLCTNFWELTHAEVCPHGEFPSPALKALCATTSFESQHFLFPLGRMTDTFAVRVGGEPCCVAAVDSSNSGFISSFYNKR